MPRIVVSPLAQADIDEIWDYIARDSIRTPIASSTGSSSGSACLRQILAWVLRATTFDPAYGGLAMPPS